MAYLKNKLQGPIISHMNITEIVYNSLISLNNTNDLYEGENEALSMNFNIKFSTFQDFILEKDGSGLLNKENFDFKIGHCIIASISESDGYSWVYRNKNKKKTSLLLIYYCNCRIELGKRQAKHPILDKQRDTPAFLERYNCEGL
ncbi:28486_t:CDS:1 [Racocetra persica]|uniref:28486_t:CDS:1 n=1 Tax=Racocetra persica TaxID=160502 RepID=A0ACA9RAK1_9GLOM|nr:28486_t:CDS:1 [Racocetra persica]